MCAGLARCVTFPPRTFASSRPPRRTHVGADSPLPSAQAPPLAAPSGGGFCCSHVCGSGPTLGCGRPQSGAELGRNLQSHS